ncbi:Adenylate kinase 8 [Chytridiales sp. JEL 0842]|nr:Adenylate kinase 8 [Chytridiales sp. JEL 0842]
MDYILDPNKVQSSFAEYADSHELFDLFERLVTQMLIDRPQDPLQWMIDEIQKPVVPAIVVYGPPSAGHSVICEKIAKAHDAIHISTGNLLQTAIEKQTAMGVQAKPYIERGNLVPDQLMLSLVTQRLKEADVLARGYVLEGFPRTREQAMQMQMKGILPSHFVCIDVPDAIIINHVTQIRIDPETRTTYHLQTNPPPADNPEINARLIQRASHTEPMIKAKLAQFRRHYSGVTSCFSKNGRRFVYESGIVGNETQVLKEVLEYTGTRKQTRAPRQFKIVIVGKPGSGRTSVARKLAEKYGFVHVSPRTVIQEEVASNSPIASQVAPFIDNPEEAPDDLLALLISTRLKQPDCTSQGWILSSFPSSSAQSQLLQSHGIQPTRVFFLRTPSDSVNISRLKDRRWDPVSGRTVNLNSLPSDVEREEVLESWVPLRPTDADEEDVKRRMEKWGRSWEELEGVYGVRRKVRPPTSVGGEEKGSSVRPSVANPGKGVSGGLEETQGIMQEVESDGLGEGEAGEVGEGLRKVLERVEGLLLKPVPVVMSL